MAYSDLAGYISMMIPSNMLLSLFKPRIYLPTVVIIWGVVSLSLYLLVLLTVNNSTCWTSGLGRDWLCPELPWSSCPPLPRRCDRGSLLPGMHLLPLFVVYQDRTTIPHSHLLLWVYFGISVWWTHRSRHHQRHGRCWRIRCLGKRRLCLILQHWLTRSPSGGSSSSKVP